MLIIDAASVEYRTCLCLMFVVMQQKAHMRCSCAVNFSAMLASGWLQEKLSSSIVTPSRNDCSTQIKKTQCLQKNYDGNDRFQNHETSKVTLCPIT